MSREWYTRSLQREYAEFRLFQRFECARATPAMLDALWADGWRHFGTQFFRDVYGVVENRFRMIIPLRIDLDHFSLSKSQRRVLRRNGDLRIDFREAAIDAEKETMFQRHKERFASNVPKSIREFLSPEPASVPCQALECVVYDADRLIAASFLDLGDNATSSVYAVFDPDDSHRSLGVLTLLHEIDFARRTGRRYVYLGYAHIVPSHYEYKKHFSGTEFYDWQGTWRPLAELPSVSLPRHPIEGVDVDLLVKRSVEAD